MRRPRPRTHRWLGILAILGAAIATGVSYTAQNGLPWAGTYHVYAELPDGSKITVHADVRVGGARVGQVLAVEAEPRHGDVPPHARLRLGLQRDLKELPADTTAEVRLASVLGGKYVALVPGAAARTIPPDGTIPLRQGIPSIDADEALQIFRPRARLQIQSFVREIGDAFAGRGTALNAAIGNTAAALPGLTRVLATLNGSDLAGFLHGTAGLSRALAPVGGTLGTALEHGAVTLAALDDDALDRTLALAPRTEADVTRALAAARPALEDAADVAVALRPAVHELPAAAHQLVVTGRLAIPVARETRSLAPTLSSTFKAVDQFGRSATSRKALKALGTNDLATFGGSAFVGLGAILQTAAKGQLNCNSLGLWVRNLASTASEGDAGGHWLRMIAVLDPAQMLHVSKPAGDLHANVYPHENAHECEAGNEPYVAGQQIGNPGGHQATHTEATG